MDYKVLLESLLNNPEVPIPVKLANFNSAQASLRRSLKRYNASVDALGIGVKYNLLCKSKGEGDWELTIVPSAPPSYSGSKVKFVIMDEAIAKSNEVSDDDFNWGVTL